MTTWRYTYEDTPPTKQDIDILRRQISLLEAGEFREVIQRNPPKIVFDHPAVARNPKINAAYFPGQNTVSFKVGRVFPESVQHEFFHAGQEMYLGPSYCVLPDEIILGDNSPIRKLRPGALAIGARAVPRRIRQVMTRKYKGLLVSIKALGSLPLNVTAEHPILTAKLEFEHYYPRIQYIPRKIWRYTHKIRYHVKTLTWKNAIDLDVGDFLVRPKMQEEYLDSWSGVLSEELAELMGLYCAEGSIWNVKGEPRGVVLSLGSHENALIERAKELCHNTVNRDTFTVTQGSTTRVCVTSRNLALFLKENLGSSCYDKHIPDSIMYGRRNILWAFIQSYLKGDGSPNKGRKSSSFTSVSKLLALQIQLAMTRFDSAVSLRENNAGDVAYIQGRKVHRSISYVGTVLYDDRAFTRKTPQTIPSDDANFYPYIRSISASHYDGLVANISVEGDPTFLVSNVVTHNCSTHDCEEAAYQFERMHPKILLRMETRIPFRREP